MSQYPWLKYYDTGVPYTLKYPNNSIYGLIAEASQQYPKRCALNFMGNIISYHDLINLVVYFSGALNNLGLKKGDRVMLLLPNCPQFVIAYLALRRLGMTVVLANPLNVERELIFKFFDSEAKGVVTLDLFSQRINNIKKELKLGFIIYTSISEFMPLFFKLCYPVKRFFDKKIPATCIEQDQHTYFFSDLVKKKQFSIAAVCDYEKLAVLIYSGGTTGISKGIMLSERAIVANAWQVGSWVKTNKHDSFLTVLPLFHGFGMNICMNVPLIYGGTIILFPSFKAKDVVQAIVRYKPSFFAGVPAMYIAIKELANINKYSLKSLRGLFVGAAPLSLAVMCEFEKRTGAVLIEGYGLTEVVTAVACNPFRGQRKPGTIGIPFPDVYWKIVDLDNGDRELPPGESGEVIIKCPELMSGYLNQPELTLKVIRDGWLYTGDIGVMDKEGYITLIDRKKDLIIINGFNVFPSEIDKVLHNYYKVAEAVAVGLPHPHKGEYIKVYIVPKVGQTVTPQEIIEFCKKNFSAYMVPKEVEIRLELPKSMIGKVLRRALREEEEKKYLI